MDNKLTVGKLREIISKFSNDAVLKIEFTIDQYDDYGNRTGLWGTVNSVKDIDIEANNSLNECKIILWDEAEYDEN